MNKKQSDSSITYRSQSLLAKNDKKPPNKYINSMRDDTTKIIPY